MNEHILKLEHVKKILVTKSDGEVIKNIILPDINFKIKKGEFTSITGTSGSGKTTLLYLMGGLDKPSDGKVYLDGQEISSLKEEELAKMRNEKLGFVYQFHFLLPEFTALENVMMPMLARGKSSIPIARKRAKKLLDEMNLGDKLNSKPNQLSGGQQQRVAIARALSNNPILLLADEPTGNLDSKNSENIYDLFERLNKENNQTIIVVTHDEHFASKTHRIIHLVDGKIDHDKYL